MTPRSRRAAPRGLLVAAPTVLASIVVPPPGALQAAETPRRGGVLMAVIGADAPSHYTNQKLQDVWLSED